MTVFRLKQFASTSAHAMAGAVRWNYDRAELIADGVVHGIGVFGGVVAATVLIVLAAVYASPFEVAVVSVYVAGLLAMLVLSATYNLWPISRAKWLLRRFDHSAIYVLIAATYTPFITQLKDSIFAVALLIGVWCVAIVGAALSNVTIGRLTALMPFCARSHASPVSDVHSMARCNAAAHRIAQASLLRICATS